MKLGLLLLGSTLMALQSWAAESNFARTFQVGQGASFALDSHKGYITTRIGAVGEIQVNARMYFPEGVEGDERVFEHVHIEARQNGDLVSIKVDYDNDGARPIWRSFLGNGHQVWPAVDFDIMLPETCRLEIESHKSIMDIDAPLGQVEIESHKGKGEIRGVRGDFHLETHKGSFDVEILEMGDVKVETHKGEVDLAVYNARDFEIRGDSHKGLLAFSGRDVPVVSKKRESSVNYRDGSGQRYMRLDTHKGEIRVRFVD